jgi:transcriptional regulator with GAF, ATPase, and Fis domain
MTAHIDEEALRSSLQWLREAAFDADVAGVMKRTVDAVHGVFGYGGAGIMFITESGYLSYVAASDEAARQLEEAQASAGQGPCYESYVYAREVVSADVHADSRWPELRTRLSVQVRAVAGTPILLGGSPVGTLNVYRDEPVEWDKSDVNALIAYSGLIADVLATALAAQEHGIVADQLQYALDYRVVIETSKPQCCHICGLLASSPAPSLSGVVPGCWFFSQGRRLCCPRGVWCRVRRRSTSAGPARTTISLMAGCR